MVAVFGLPLFGVWAQLGVQKPLWFVPCADTAKPLAMLADEDRCCAKTGVHDQGENTALIS